MSATGDNDGERYALPAHFFMEWASSLRRWSGAQYIQQKMIDAAAVGQERKTDRYCAATKRDLTVYHPSEVRNMKDRELEALDTALVRRRRS
jgi:hypothetical protein